MPQIRSKIEGIESMYQGSGYKTTTPIELCNLLAALKLKLISFAGVRVFFACIELAAIREAAARSRNKVKNGSRRQKNRGVRYRVDELERLTGFKCAKVMRELKALEQAGVLIFSDSAISIIKTVLPSAKQMLELASPRRSPKRAIPIPRTLILFIADCTKSALGVTLIAYMMRSLGLRRGEETIRSAGSAKASWIADTFGLSLRAVRSARKELIRLGIISEDDSNQLKLNRSGSYFDINTNWKPKDKETEEAVNNLPNEYLKFAPPPAKNCTEFAPPNKYKETYSINKNHKTQKTEQSGFFNEYKKRTPTLHKIQTEDLKRVGTLLVLFGQAVKAGWLKDTEANKLKFLSAAVRANAVGDDPVRVFVTIVRRELWHYITQAQEDRAAQALRRYLDKKEQRNANSVHFEAEGLAKLFSEGSKVLRGGSWTSCGMLGVGEIMKGLGVCLS